MPAEWMIEASGLSRAFAGNEAVRGLDLRIRRGEIYGFLGPNGAGKTTTIRMVCGLLRPTAGAVRIDGLDRRADPRRARALLALAPDTPPLYEYLTAREYVGFVCSLYAVPVAERDARREQFLAAFDLAARGDDLCRSYSHGMRKKLHLAAILSVDPPLLVLDEPTNGLDPGSVRIVKDVLRAARGRGTTVFLSTHVLSVAEAICDRVGILHHGRLLAEGSMQELRQSDAATLEDVFLELTGAAGSDGSGTAAGPADAAS